MRKTDNGSKPKDSKCASHSSQAEDNQRQKGEVEPRGDDQQQNKERAREKENVRS
jgi:hypothetical protein